MAKIRVIVEAEVDDELVKRLLESLPGPPNELEGELTNVSGRFKVRIVHHDKG